MKTRSWTGPALGLLLLLSACNEVNNFPPAAPAPLPPAPPSQFNITGHWEALSDQGRRIAFDVSPQGALFNTRINFHHDCLAGRLRLTIDGLDAQVAGDTFSGTMLFRINDAGNLYIGRFTLTGRFEADDRMRGGFVSSITDKPPNDVYGVCFPTSGTFDGYKDP